MDSNDIAFGNKQNKLLMKKDFKYNRDIHLGNDATKHMRDCYDGGYLQAIYDFSIEKDGVLRIGYLETPISDIIMAIF